MKMNNRDRIPSIGAFKSQDPAPAISACASTLLSGVPGSSIRSIFLPGSYDDYHSFLCVKCAARLIIAQTLRAENGAGL